MVLACLVVNEPYQLNECFLVVGAFSILVIAEVYLIEPALPSSAVYA